MWKTFAIISLSAAALGAPMSLHAQQTRPADFTDRYTHEILALDPVSATAAGYNRHPDARTGATLLLDELLNDHRAAGLRHRREVLSDLRQQFFVGE